MDGSMFFMSHSPSHIPVSGSCVLATKLLSFGDQTRQDAGAREESGEVGGIGSLVLLDDKSSQGECGGIHL